jgi:hypothetical protein
MVEEETGKHVTLNASTYSIDSPIRNKITSGLIPMRRDNLTTVRVRTKDNSFMYGESNMMLDGTGQMSSTGYMRKMVDPLE